MGDIRDLAAFRLIEDGPVIETVGTSFPSPPSSFAFTGRLLAVDQAVAKSGCVVLDISSRGEVFITLKAMWQAPEAVKGHVATLEMAAKEYEFFCHMIDAYTPDQIVHEMPPVGGSMARPESSLVAATSLRCAASNEGLPITMMGAQKVKKRWTGNGNAKKPVVREALLAWRPELGKAKPWNEDICDAIALGLAWAEKEGK